MNSFALDFFVTLILSVGQLVEPIDSTISAQKIQEIQEQSTCSQLDTVNEEFKNLNCRSLRDEGRSSEEAKQRYDEVCQPLIDKHLSCRLDETNISALRFTPKPFEDLVALDNKSLIAELRNTCIAIQDRVYLPSESWSAGEFSDRSNISSIVSLVKTEPIQFILNERLIETENREIDVIELSDIVRDLCFWKSSLSRAERKYDIRGSLSYFFEIIRSLPRDKTLPSLTQRNTILDRNGVVIGNFPHKERIQEQTVLINRINAKTEEIPDLLFDAFVAVEDKRFYNHKGLDFSTLLGHAEASRDGELKGGSTFTMQAIKNRFFLGDNIFEQRSGKRSYLRKIKEFLMAPYIEKNYSKKEILTYYLNLIDLDRNTQGLKASSISLFNKSNLMELELHEIALLAALPKGTSLYSPRSNPQNALERRNLVLFLMMEQGFITEEEKNEAQQKPLDVKSLGKLNEDQGYSLFYKNQVMRKFDQLQSSNTADLSNGGFKVKTALDIRLQKEVVKSVQRGLKNFERRNGRSNYNMIEETVISRRNSIQSIVESGVNWNSALKNFISENSLNRFRTKIAVKLDDGWGVLSGETLQLSSTSSSVALGLSTFDLALVDVIVDENGNSTHVDVLEAFSTSRVAQFNLTNTVLKLEGDWRASLNLYLHSMSYHDTPWTLAIRLENQWGLPNGDVVSVRSSDRSKFNAMKLYDVVALDSASSGYALQSPTEVQGAAVVIDIETGEVLAISGGFSSGKNKDRGFNRATRALKQPGSTVKPITYLYALNKGVEPNKRVTNSFVAFPPISGFNGYEHCSQRWTPNNAGGANTPPVTMRTALTRSYNRALVGTFIEASGVRYNNSGANSFVDYSHDDIRTLLLTFEEILSLGNEMGLYRSFVQMDSSSFFKRPCLSALIGSYETTPLNVAQAYASIGSGGLKRKGIFINSIEDSSERLLVSSESRTNKEKYERFHKAYDKGQLFAPEAFGMVEGVSPEAVLKLKEMLSNVVKNGTARNLPDEWNGRVAGKTGTTNDSVDVWFAGFNSKIAVAVWVGYDDKNGRYQNLGTRSTGGNVAMPIFQNIMSSFYELYPEEVNKNLKVER